MWALIVRVLTGSLLPSLERAYRAKLEAGNDTDRMHAESVIKHLEARQGLIQAGMQTRAFWFVWCLFAVPLGLWWAVVMADTILPWDWAIPDLPNSIKPWAETIFNNLFLSGGLVSAVSIGGAFLRGRR